MGNSTSSYNSAHQSLPGGPKLPIADTICRACTDNNHDNHKNSIVSNSERPVCYAYSHSGCPLTRNEVGRSAWGYLHTIAAWYPQEPPSHIQDRMKTFMTMMAYTYPCGYCADETVKEIKHNPPRVSSQYELSQWLCEIHNEVNERLGKPKFDCTKVNQRWRNGMPGCN